MTSSAPRVRPTQKALLSLLNAAIMVNGVKQNLLLTASMENDTLNMYPSRDKKAAQNGHVWTRRASYSQWFLNTPKRGSFLTPTCGWPYFVFLLIFSRWLKERSRKRFEEKHSFREAIKRDIKLASFLIYFNAATCYKISAQLEIGNSTVHNKVKKIIKCMPATHEFGILAMNEFKRTVNLSQWVGAVDGTHIHWLKCPPH